jgi:hypothetical protein
MSHQSCKAGGIRKKGQLPVIFYEIHLASSLIKFQSSVNSFTQILRSHTLLHCDPRLESDVSSDEEENALTEGSTGMLSPHFRGR